MKTQDHKELAHLLDNCPSLRPTPRNIHIRGIQKLLLHHCQCLLGETYIVLPIIRLLWEGMAFPHEDQEST